MQADPTATVRAVATAVAATPAPQDAIITTIVTAIVGGVVSLGFFLVGQMVWRAITSTDRNIAHVEDAARRDVEHLQETSRREADKSEGRATHDDDRTYAAFIRELNQIHDRLTKIADTQVDIQKSLLKVELRQDGVEDYIESQKDVTRIMGRRQRAAT